MSRLGAEEVPEPPPAGSDGGSAAPLGTGGAPDDPGEVPWPPAPLPVGRGVWPPPGGTGVGTPVAGTGGSVGTGTVGVGTCGSGQVTPGTHTGSDGTRLGTPGTLISGVGVGPALGAGVEPPTQTTPARQVWAPARVGAMVRAAPAQRAAMVIRARRTDQSGAFTDSV